MVDEHKKKAVIFVWPYLEWGGAQVYFMGIMKLARERYDVRALMPKGSAERLLAYLQEMNVTCEFFDAHVDISAAPTLAGKLRRRWHKARAEIVMLRYLGWHRVRHSLLHVDFGPWSSFWTLLYLALSSEVFVTLHTALPHASWLRRLEWKLKFRLLCAVPGFHLLASNRNMIESLKVLLPARVISGIPLAYSGVDQQEIKRTLEGDFNRAEVCQNFKLAPESFFVFAMGQFIDRKGCWVLLDSAQELHRDYPEICFVWISTSQLNPETEQRIEQFGLGESFRIITSNELGVGRAGLLSLLLLADLFVLPSLEEGLPVALIEAMALGKPCVASNINAIPEAIQDGDTGVLVPSGDSKALASAIVKMKVDPQTRARLAANGQNVVLKNFDERMTAQITVDLYDTYA